MKKSTRRLFLVFLSLLLGTSYLHWTSILLYEFFRLTKPLSLTTLFYLKGHEPLSATLILGFFPFLSFTGALLGSRPALSLNPTARRVLLSASTLPLALFLFSLLL